MKCQQLRQDVEISVEKYVIKEFKTVSNAYEGHYLHSQLKTEKVIQSTKFRKGDYVVLTNQIKNKYIVETLEPQGPDSYFSWNFFDGILAQKEGYSAYVFEDLAATFLKENPSIKARLEERKKRMQNLLLPPKHSWNGCTSRLLITNLRTRFIL